MIDRQELLATLKPLVTQLEESIRERALATPEVSAHLEQEHHTAVVAERTAMSLDEWRDGEITQAAVAWVLGCVFVRFLEDNVLIDHALISGPGDRRAAALGYREEHFRTHPEHSDREYLEACFRAIASFPAVASLYDERHNPIWRLGPTADGARALRETFTAIDPATGALVHDYTDPELGTRFLGDLYQDLSDAAKKRFALLQTPDFIEEFILDRTLSPAIDEFGVDKVRLIDPTCGSGHFLIGAFERLFAVWLDREPGTNATVLAQRALDQIAGVDLNPYATAIARFRLVVAALRVCGVTRLVEAPAFALHLATGDSLLHGPLPADGAATLFDANRLSKNIEHVYETEDGDELKEILGRGYHVVVGNPPYIAVQDNALRDAYRMRYASCHGHFVLTVPFMERFFELAQVRDDGATQKAGFVGKITGNNFMKREFGAPLVEQFLRSIDVQLVIDASGAFIPGHGTPTVLLFGRARQPTSSTLRVVDGIRGEPTQPANPAEGLVWTAITSLVDRPGEQNGFVRTSVLQRDELFQHPMTLGVGRGIRTAIERDGVPLGARVQDVGFCTVTREDDAFMRSGAIGPSARTSAYTVEYITGERVRDWGLNKGERVLWPYERDTLDVTHDANVLRALWPLRALLRQRVAFGKTQTERGLEWHEYSMFMRNRFKGNTILWPKVSSDVHFVHSPQAVVAKDSVGVIVPDEPGRYELCAALNSSVGAFWLKQVCQPKGGAGIGRGIHDEAWEMRFDFNAENVKQLPVRPTGAAHLAAALDRLAEERASTLSDIRDETAEVDLRARLLKAREADIAITERMVSLQEELDWQVLAAYGFAPRDLPVLGEGAPATPLGQRAFEIVLARRVAAGGAETTWFERHNSTPIMELPEEWPADYRAVVEQRIRLIEGDPDVGSVECAEHKRRWNRPAWDDRQREALSEMVLDALEDRAIWTEGRLRSTAELTDRLRGSKLAVDALELLADRKDADLATTVRRLVSEASVPHLPAERHTEQGLRKRARWELLWGRQRAEDRGEGVGAGALPTKYSQADYQTATVWKHRGKLDVPKERFVLITNAGWGADTSPVVGWAGWDERDLARALASRIMELREQEATEAERLVPLLAGVLELLPWIHLWYPESDPVYGGPPGRYFEGWLDGQLAELAITRDNLRAWRPTVPTRRRKAKVGVA